MTISTFSPAFVIVFAAVLLWLLMDIRYQDLARPQKFLIPLAIFALAIVNHFLRLKLGPELYGKTILVSEHIPFFILFTYLTKHSGIKMLFMIMSAVVFTSPAVLITSLIRNTSPGDSVSIFVSNITTYVLILLLAQFVFRPGFNYLLKYGDDKLFLRFSTIPFIYYIYVYAIQHVDVSSISSPMGVIIRLIPTIQVFLFYFLLLFNYQDLSIQREKDTTQAAVTQDLDAAEEQLILLNNVRTQAAIYQHDMRHHLNALNALLSTQKFNEALSYIQRVRRDVESITPKCFCENEIVNLICSSFHSEAQRLGVRLNVKATLPLHLPIPDPELCAILSNGLENSLNAVFELKEPLKWVDFYTEVKLNKLLIEITNPYMGDVIIRDDLPVSDQPGHSYGSRSIKTIVDHYHGICSFEPNNGLFTLRIVIPLHQSMQSL